MTTDSPFADYLDLIDAASEIAIHPQSLRRLVKQGRIPVRKVWGKYLIKRDVLDIFKANYDPQPGWKTWPVMTK